MVSERLKRYIRADRDEKEAKSVKNSEKAYIQKLLSRATRRGLKIPGISYYERETIKLDDNEVFEYVRSCCTRPMIDSSGEVVLDPETGEPIHGPVDEELFLNFCKQTVDYEILGPMSKELDLSILPLPSYCYKIERSEVIKVDHKRIDDERV